MIEIDILSLVVCMGVPSAITGFCFWRIQKSIDKKDKRQEVIEQARQKNEFLLIKSVGAAIALGEATANAVKRIPDAHCNGDMEAALSYAQEIKHEQKDFLAQQSVNHLYHGGDR